MSFARRTAKYAIGVLPTLLTLTALGGIAWWGAQNDWRIPGAEAPAPGEGKGPAIRTSPGPADNPNLRASIVFASPEDVRRAGFQFSPARTQNLTRFVTATGSVGYDPALYTQLSARAAGTVAWVGKVPGQPVADGEVLALIDAGEVGRAKNELLSALRQHEKQATVVEQLRQSSGTVAGRAVGEAQALLDDARFRLATAQQALLNLDLTVRYQDLQPLPVEDRLSRVQFLGLPEDVATRIRNKTQSANLLPVKAPFGGWVVRQTVTPGETVSAGKPLFVVGGVTRVYLELAIDPADAAQVRIGHEVRFTPDADPEFEARGIVAHLLPEVDPATHKVWAHAEAQNSDGRLRPNAYGRGRVVVAEVPGATVVPEAAVQPDGSGWVVFVRDGDAAFQARRVRPGVRGDGLVQVDTVAPGEEVVTTGSHALLGELQRDKFGTAD